MYKLTRFVHVQVRPMLAILLARLQKVDAQGLESVPEVRIVPNGCSWLPFRDQPGYSGFRQDDSRVPFYRLGHYIARLAAYLTAKRKIPYKIRASRGGVL